MHLIGPTVVHDAVSGARIFAERDGIAEADGQRLAILVEELVTNLYDHGGLSDADAVGVELVKLGDTIRLAIADQGQAFDPGPATQPEAVPARGGGAGLAMVREWASDMDYRSADGVNRLTVRLPLT